MADNEYALGDVTLDGEIDASDVQAYDIALSLNGAHTTFVNEGGTPTPIDVVNGGFTPEAAKVASLHQNGFVSGVDEFLLNKYVNISGTRPADIQTFIAQLDSQEIIPPVDPDVETLQEYRDDVTNNILDLKVYQADVMLTLQTLSAKSLNDMWEKSQRLWGEAFRMDYDSIQRLDTSMNQGLDTEYTHAEDSGWKLGQPDILSSIKTIVGVVGDGLTKAQCEEIRDKYWTPSAMTFSDPPTQEEYDKLITRLISIPVAEGVDFYDTYKNVEPSPSPGPEPTPGTYDPGNNGLPPTQTVISLSGSLQTWVNGCSNASDFTNMFGADKPNPHQVVTVHVTSGSQAIINRYEYSGSAWTKLTNDISGYVGANGVSAPSGMNEGVTSDLTPSGAYMLGNYSSATGDVGAFGAGSVSGTLKINYVPVVNGMYWIDGTAANFDVDHLQGTSWYNTFMNLSTSSNRQLIQWKRSDWDDPGTNVLTDDTSNPSLQTKTDNAVFRYGRYYKDGYINPGDYKENLYYYTTTQHQYDHAVVIRFNMPPHVSVPVLPGNAGSGSAFFVHVDTTHSGTGGCVSMDDSEVVNLIKWLDHSKNPYIFIRLGNA